MTQKTEVLNVLFLGLTASPFSYEGVLYEGLGKSKLEFLIKKRFKLYLFFSSSIFTF
jgi:hypothetical protein